MDCWKDYIVTAGTDGKWRIWDARKADTPLWNISYQGASVNSIDVSMTGILHDWFFFDFVFFNAI